MRKRDNPPKEWSNEDATLDDIFPDDPHPDAVITKRLVL